MAGLFDLLGQVVDITQPPTLGPPIATSAGVVSSPFVEPERPAQVGALTAVGDHATKDARMLAAIAASGSMGLSDAELSIKLQWPRTTVCSTRGRIRTRLWIARRVQGGYGVHVLSWRLATLEEQAQNAARERALTAAGRHWSHINPFRGAR